ncbi:MAG: sigma-54 dependent transcriptional regulator [Chloroflexi bacterium]|nr:sigma-54 dependent transcriptional regulator [Chloroflexota bacterium]
MTYRILIADDSDAIRDVLREALVDEGYDVSEAASGDEVLAEFNGNEDPKPDLVLMDIRMPGKDGLEVLRTLRLSRDAELPIIVMTAFGSASTAIEAMKLGAFDYIAKPFELEEVTVTVERFFERQDLSDRVVRLIAESNRDEILIGDSPVMQDVYKTVGRVARSDATVLVSGETGTGKELVATVLHRNSTYSAGPLIKVNCAALPETLLESELFGHEKGAFTGAVAQRKGRFELANKGTIFLDEVGEMTLSTQKKLLRVLQEREFERVGGTNSIKVDTRVVAATNKDLPREIDAGNFREDLYYRLNVIAIELPPLRERRSDIPLLVEHFLNKHRYGRGSAPARISQEAMSRLLAHDWPGNVRELENTIERAVIMARGGIIAADHVTFPGQETRRPVDVTQAIADGTTLDAFLKDMESRYLREALRQAGDSQTVAAGLIGIDPEELRHRIERTELS